MDLTIPQHQLTLSGNTAGVLTRLSSGTVTLAGGNNITLSQAGNAVTFSAPATSSLSATGIVSISTNGSTISIGASESVQTQGILSAGVSTGGNSSGDTTVNTGSRLVFVGGNNITVSQGTAAGASTITISGPNVGGAQTGISGLANSQTTYTSGTVSLSELGAITIRSTTGQQFQFSVNPQSVQPETQTFIAGISASDTLYTSGNVRFTGVGGGVTVSSNTGQRVDISVAAQSVQPETQTFVGGIGNSETTYTSGTVSLSELGAITIRSTTGNQFQFSVNSQSVQTNDIPRLGVSTGGNTSGDTTVNSGTRFVLVGSNGITLSQGTAASATTVTISGITQSVQTQGILNVALSNIGNTSGDTGINSGTRMVLAGGNNITLSASTAANATTVTISAPNLGAGAMSAGVSNLGNTAGSTGITGTQLVLVGTNMVSLSQSTGANGGTVSINATQSVQTQGIPNMGVSTGGATSGDTTVNSGTRFVLVGTNITMSQGTAANATTVTVSAPATSSLSGTGLVSISTNGSTISIGVPGTTQRIWFPWANAEQVVAAIGQGTLHMQPYAIHQPVQLDRFVVPVQYSQATNSTLTVTMSAWAGLYTKNVSTLSLLHSGSGTFSINGSGTASSAQNSGLKNMTFGWTTTVHPNDYWLAFVSRTTTAGANASLSNVLMTQANSVWSGLMGVAVAASDQRVLGLGTYSATTSAMPASIGFNQLTGSASLAQRPPMIWLLSQSA